MLTLKVNASELMIGDLVIIDGRVAKITGFHSNALMGLGVQLENDSTFYSEERLRPIVIRPDILKDNGFFQTENPRHFMLKGWNENIIVQFLSDGFHPSKPKPHALLKIDKDDCLNYFQVEVKFIHQLQQAMRLAGCIKQIKL